MIPIIVIICIAAVIAFLLSIKITLRIKYTEKLEAYIRILFIKIKCRIINPASISQIGISYYISVDDIVTFICTYFYNKGIVA